MMRLLNAIQRLIPPQWKLLPLWQDPLLRSIIKNSSYIFSSNGIAIVLSMVQGIFAARLLGLTNFGILAGTVIPIASNIHRLVSFRMSEPVVKYLNQYLAQEQSGVSSAKNRAAATVKGALLTEALTALLAYGVLLLAAPLAASYQAKDPQTQPLFLIYGLYLLTHLGYETSTGVLQAFNQFDRIALVNLVQSGITATMIFLAFLFERGILEVLLAYLLGKGFAGLATLWLALRRVNQELGKDWWRASLRWPPIGDFEWEADLPPVAAGLLERDGAIESRNFARILFNMTV